jgi:hypothetical protein
MNNGATAANAFTPEMLAGAVSNPELMQVLQAWQQQQQQQQAAGPVPGLPQINHLAQPHQTTQAVGNQAAQNPLLQMSMIQNLQQAAAPQNQLQQQNPTHFLQQPQDTANVMQMLPLFMLMAQASQVQQQQQQQQLQRWPMTAPLPPAQIDPSSVRDTMLAERLRDARRTRLSLRLSIERMAEVRSHCHLIESSPSVNESQTHGYTAALWKDYFVDRTDIIAALAADESDDEGAPRPASAPVGDRRPYATAHHKSPKRKRKRAADADHDSASSDNEAPLARVTTSMSGRVLKGTARAMADAVDTNGRATRLPWTKRDVKMIAEVILEIGEPQWDAMKYLARGELLHEKVC